MLKTSVLIGLRFFHYIYCNGSITLKLFTMKNLLLIVLAFVGLAFAQAENAPPVYDVGDDLVSVEITSQDFTADVDLYSLEVVKSNATAEVTAKKISFKGGKHSVAILTKNRGCEYLFLTAKRPNKDVGWNKDLESLFKDQSDRNYLSPTSTQRYYGPGSGGLANS